MPTEQRLQKREQLKQPFEDESEYEIVEEEEESEEEDEEEVKAEGSLEKSKWGHWVWKVGLLFDKLLFIYFIPFVVV